MEQQKKSVISSLLYKLAESCLVQGVAFIVSVLLARMLSPSDYGVLAVIAVFIAISQVFVQSGLNTALIQKKEIDALDVHSAFYMSLMLATAVYAALYFAAPAISAFYEQPIITPVLRVLALTLFPGALFSVLGALVARQMRFKLMLYSNLASTMLSGIVGVWMAYSGMGCWALVGQQMTNQFGACLLLWALVRWRPRAQFSIRRAGVLFRFGGKLLASSLLDTGYQNLRTLVIGKKFDSDALGFYNRGKQFPELLMNSVNGSIQSVMLPALSMQQHDPARMKSMMRRSVMVSSFFVFPLMMGLAVVARPLVSTLLTDKWLPCVPFLQVFCFDFAFYPIHTANLQAINAQGRSDVFLKLELIKKTYGIAILCITVFCFDSVLMIALGGAVSTVISSFVNAAPNQKLLGYRYAEQMRDVLPAFLLSLAMGAVIAPLALLALSPLPLLLLQAVCGAAVYTGLSLLCKPECLRYVLSTLQGLLRREASHEEESV